MNIYFFVLFVVVVVVCFSIHWVLCDFFCCETRGRCIRFRRPCLSVFLATPFRGCMRAVTEAMGSNCRRICRHEWNVLGREVNWHRHAVPTWNDPAWNWRWIKGKRKHTSNKQSICIDQFIFICFSFSLSVSLSLSIPLSQNLSLMHLGNYAIHIRIMGQTTKTTINGMHSMRREKKTMKNQLGA